MMLGIIIGIVVFGFNRFLSPKKKGVTLNMDGCSANPDKQAKLLNKN